jgi:H+/gluconate symporter-like permease
MSILRKIFLALFIISTLVVWGLALDLNRSASINPSPTGESSDAPSTPETIQPGTEPTAPAAPAAQNSGALIGSVIASATTLIGFIVTTMISWRKEKRDAALADVQYRKLETELEKSRLELEKLKKSGSKKKPKK